MGILDEIDKGYADLIGDQRILSEVRRGSCTKCNKPIYYPEKLQDQIVCCPYCRVEFK